MLCYVIWLVGKRVVDFLLVLIELFFALQLSRLRRYERILVKIVVFERGWVTLSTNLSLEIKSNIIDWSCLVG